MMIVSHMTGYFYQLGMSNKILRFDPLEAIIISKGDSMDYIVLFITH